MSKVVILLPGILGSNLYKGDKLVWPGTTWELKFGYSKERFLEILDPNLEPRGVVESYYQSQYMDILRPLESEGMRFSRIAQPNQVSSTADFKGLYIFAYDWRKDNREAARKLADVVDKMIETAPGLEIILLCHSMGGLVARYYLESEELQPRQGLAKVKQVIFMGTPHQGAPKALSYIFGKKPNLWLSKDQARELAAQPMFNSIYQLLPVPGFHFLRSDVKYLDIYQDPVCCAVEINRTMTDLRLDPGKLDDARQFHSALHWRKLLRSSVKVFCFYAAHHETETSLRYLAGDKDFVVEKTAPAGDGTVPVFSACIPGSPSLSVENEHGKIYASRGLLRMLQELLGERFQLAAGEEAIVVSLSNPFVSQGTKLQGVLHVHELIASEATAWKTQLKVYTIQEQDGVRQRKLSQVRKTIALSGSNALQVSFELDTSSLAQGEYEMDYQTELKGLDAENFNMAGTVGFVVLGERE